MSKKKARVIATIAVEPHNPAERVEILVAGMDADTGAVLSALIVEHYERLWKASRAAKEALAPRKDLDTGSSPVRGSTLGPGKRACSKCRQPGHRAKNCTAQFLTCMT